MKKICKHHGDLSEENVKKYIRNRRGRSELVLYCKLCHRKTAGEARKRARKLYREGLTDKEPIDNIKAREDRKKNPEKYAIWAATGRLKKGDRRNVYEIARRLGLSESQYDSLLEDQNFKCAICNGFETRINKKGVTARLSLDHHHETEKVRGFLCHACNLMIGHFKENISTMESAIKYLIKHGELCQKQ